MIKNLIIPLLFIVSCTAQPKQDIDSKIEQQNLIETVAVLTSNEMGGRKTGSGYDIKAAHYIEKKLSEMGYKPLIDNNALVEFTIPGSSDKGYNVVMVLNSKNKKAQNILMGAHYDHLGIAEAENPYLGIAEGDIYRGANDNASGVATMLELARIAAQDSLTNKHNLIVCAFGGEEIGIIGSHNLFGKLETNGTKVDFMINFEMTGGLDDEKTLEILGNDTFDMEKYLTRVNNNDSLLLKQVGVFTHLSDHIRFVNGNGVAVFATTNVRFYHHPKDDMSLINFDGMSKVARFSSNFLKTLLSDKSLPKGEKVINR